MISVFNMILRLSLTGGVTCLVCLAVSALLRNKLPKAWLYRLWLIVTVSFIVPVPTNLRLPIPQIRFPSAYVSSASVAADDTIGKDNGNTALSAQNPATIQAPENKQDPRSAKGSSGIIIDAYLIITITWIAGAGGMLLWDITGYCLTAGRLKKGRVLLTTNRVPVYESVKITTPLLVGLFRPVIYLPKDFKTLILLSGMSCAIGAGGISGANGLYSSPSVSIGSTRWRIS